MLLTESVKFSCLNTTGNFKLLEPICTVFVNNKKIATEVAKLIQPMTLCTILTSSTPVFCQFLSIGGWQHTSDKLFIQGNKVLTQYSYQRCQYGGSVSVLLSSIEKKVKINKNTFDLTDPHG